MDLKNTETSFDDMPSFEDNLDSFDFNDTDMMEDSDPAIPIVNDVEGGDSFNEFLNESDDSLPPVEMDSDLTSDFDINLNDFSHAEESSDLDLSDENPAEDSDNTDFTSDFSEDLSTDDFSSMDEDEEPVSLSDDELANILNDTDDDEVEIQDVPTAEEFSDGSVEDTILNEDFSMPEMTLEDVSDSDGGISDTGETEEGEIALSVTELDNILEDTDTEQVIDVGSNPEEEDNLLSDEFDQDFFGQEGGDFQEEEVHQVVDSDFDALSSGDQEIVESMEGDISLEDDGFSPDFSDFDAAEAEDESFLNEISGEDSSSASIFEDDDEGPIALTPEELGNIESDVADDSGPEETASQPSIFDEEDDGPIAFDESEMASILENVTEEEAVSSGKQAAMPYRVDLDDLESEEPVREENSADAAGANLKKEELKKMMSYLDSLFGELPDDTVREFSKSEYFNLYKKIMDELDIH